MSEKKKQSEFDRWWEDWWADLSSDSPIFEKGGKDTWRSIMAEAYLAGMEFAERTRKEVMERKPCPDCAHDIPGEVHRGGGVYSLCPTCFGKGEIDGSESNGTTLGKALANLKATREREADREAMERFKRGPHDWIEDDAHENGGYECRCAVCNSIFYGHKRRHVCKVCGQKAEDAMALENETLKRK